MPPDRMLIDDRTPPVLTTHELARLLRVSESQARRMNLPALEVGRGRWRYVTAQVLEELAHRAAHAGLAVSKRST